MDTAKIRRFLERHAYSIPATGDADEMLAVLDDVDAALKKAREDVADFAALMADQRANLRDTFAAAALTGMCANPMALNRANMDGCDERMARDAYWLADAMLTAREGK